MLSIFESRALFRERQIPPMGNSARILIVDDSRANAEALAASLAIDGLETHFALSGVDAIQLLRFWQPHLFVLDIGIRNVMVSPSRQCTGVCPRPAMRASSSLRLWEKPNSSRPGPWLTSTVTASKEARTRRFRRGSMGCLHSGFAGATAAG
jgi:CheY-like chemotaxis protein